MLDVLLRALRHPNDYAGVLKKQTLTFVEQIPEGDHYYSFIFKPEQPASWNAGQHGILFLPTSKRDKGWRPFSVASSPHEGVIRIGTMLPERHSEFKEVLRTLTPGTTVTFRGPYGEFHANGAPQTIVGVAGGIGITPFRALAYDIAHGHLPHTTLKLIYGTRDSYPYQAELEAWADSTNQLDVSFVHTPEEIQTTLRNQWNIYGNDADYFISGSPGMIAGISEHCRSLGIRNIVNDPFKGY